MTSNEVVASFVAAINARDPAAMAAVMTADHCLTDGVGNHIVGIKAVLAGWHQYWASFPDYHIEIAASLGDGSFVMAHGTASASLDGNGNSKPDVAWTVPAAWRAKVVGTAISEWQVFADNLAAYCLLGIVEMKSQSLEDRG